MGFFSSQKALSPPQIWRTCYRRMLDSRWLRHLLLSFSSPFGRAKPKPKMPHLFLPKPPVVRELLQEFHFRRQKFVSKRSKFVSKKQLCPKENIKLTVSFFAESQNSITNSDHKLETKSALQRRWHRVEKLKEARNGKWKQWRQLHLVDRPKVMAHQNWHNFYNLSTMNRK